jgi:hypothetical protein
MKEMLLPPLDKCKWKQKVARLSGVLVALLGDSLQNYSELDGLIMKEVYVQFPLCM